MKKYIVFLVFCAVIIINAPAAVKSARMPDVPLIESETAVLIDGDTGQILYDKNMNRRMYPASITKVMTALLALENGNLADNIVMSYDAVFSVGRNTSHIALDEGEVITLEQALYGVAVESANDASNGIAELIGGSMDEFAQMMNERAARAGASDTHFTNAHGLPDENHYTTAHDMARIMAEAVKIPDFIKFFSAEYYEMPPTNKQDETRYFWRTGSLITDTYKYDGVIAEKTGWTPDAGYTFAVAAKKDGRTLIVVVMNASSGPSRREDTATLLDYGFNELKTVSIKAAGISLSSYSAGGINAEVRAPGDFTCLIDRSLSEEDIEIEYILYKDANNVLHVKAVFTLKAGIHGNIYRQLGEMELLCIPYDGNPADAALISEDTPDNENESDKNQNPVIAVILTVTCVLAAAYVFLYIRKIIIVRRRRRRRRRRTNYQYGNNGNNGNNRNFPRR